MGLNSNKKKTKIQVISKKKVIPICNIVLDGQELEQVYQFDYLGSLITSDSSCEKEIKRRIAMSKNAFENHKCILTNKKIKLKTKKTFSKMLRVVHFTLWM